jgi:hypothetical protein
MNEKRPHVSSTQIDLLCKCGEAYRRRYVEGEIIPPGIAAVSGKAIHRGAAENFTQKIDSHVDLPASQIIEATAAAFDAEAAAGLLFSEDETSRGAAIVLGEAKDRTVEMAEVHAKKQAPDYQPIFVERPVRLALPGSHDLLGIIDLGDDQDRVVDFKTAARSKSQTDVDESVQLTIYAAAFHAETGRKPSEVRLDTIVKTKTKTDRQVLTSSRDEADFQPLANRINAVTSAIQTGVFTPAPPGAWWCGPKWCGYWSTCPYVNSQRQAMADANA